MAMTGQNREEDFFGQEIREENDLREGADLTADSKKTMKTAGEESAGAKQKESADIGAEKDGENESAELSVEEAFEELRKILAAMQDPNVTLEESFQQYERGMKLVKYCSSRIDLVEKKVMKLSADGSLSEFEGMQDK